MHLPVVRTSSRAITRKALKTLFTSLSLRVVLEAIIERTVFHVTPRSMILKPRAITSGVPEVVDVGDEQWRVGRRGGVTGVSSMVGGQDPGAHSTQNKRPRGHRKVIPGVSPSAPFMASVGDGVVLARALWQSKLHAPSVKKCYQYGDDAGVVVALRSLIAFWLEVRCVLCDH